MGGNPPCRKVVLKAAMRSASSATSMFLHLADKSKQARAFADSSQWSPR